MGLVTGTINMLSVSVKPETKKSPKFIATVPGVPLRAYVPVVISSVVVAYIPALAILI